MKDHLREDWEYPDKFYRIRHNHGTYYGAVDRGSYLYGAIKGKDCPTLPFNKTQSKFEWEALVSEPKELTLGEAICALERGEKVECKPFDEPTTWYDFDGEPDEDGWHTWHCKSKYRIAPTPRPSVDEMKKLARLTGGVG